MSIFRTIKKLRDCESCDGTGMVLIDPQDPGSRTICAACEGSGKVEVYSRVSQGAAVRAAEAARNLPPQARAAAKERLEDHEEPVSVTGKKSKPGKDYIEEE